MKILNVISSSLLLAGIFLSFSIISCVKKETEEKIFDNRVYNNSISNGFEISTGNDTKNTLISVSDPWQGAEGIKKKLLIVRDDSLKDYPCPHIINDAKRIICLSSTHIAMLDALGATNRIVGVSGFP